MHLSLLTFIPCIIRRMCIYSTNFGFLFQMAGWMFENALAAIQSPPSIPFSVLLSTDGLHLGDIRFTKIQTTLHMQTVSITVLERWIAEWELQSGAHG